MLTFRIINSEYDKNNCIVLGMTMIISKYINQYLLTYECHLANWEKNKNSNKL